jgi:hypothetical protein
MSTKRKRSLGSEVLTAVTVRSGDPLNASKFRGNALPRFSRPEVLPSDFCLWISWEALGSVGKLVSLYRTTRRHIPCPVKDVLTVRSVKVAPLFVNTPASLTRPGT